MIDLLLNLPPKFVKSAWVVWALVMGMLWGQLAMDHMFFEAIVVGTCAMLAPILNAVDTMRAYKRGLDEMYAAATAAVREEAARQKE